MNLRPRLLAAAVVTVAASLPTADARACGGCFHEANATQTTVVTAHRMAFSISTTQTVLWDQIKYAGSPADFAWVLPVKAGAVLEISNDAWFETLDAATSAQTVAPNLVCAFTPSSSGNGSSGCDLGCGASAESADFAPGGSGGGTGASATTPPPVTVTHEGTVGPYETVTLQANVPNALPNWLTSHGYAIDPTVAPIIDAYTSEGFDFIAVRLQPGQGIQQMKPLRVVMAGSAPTLPLRMVAAGTGPNVGITLFVIGEGRWEAQNFPNGEVDPSTLTWDFSAQSSDYSTQRQVLLATNGGRTWNNAFANQGSLLSQDLVNGLPTTITVGSQSWPTLAIAYVQQGYADGETTDTSCTEVFDAFANSTQQVDGSCLSQQGLGGMDGGTPDAGTGGPCMVAPGDLDASQLVCGGLDDIAVALVGMHPVDVWLTRLEANLPHSALATDLNIQASAKQTPISNVLNAGKSINSPCGPAAGGAISSFRGGGGANRARIAMFAVILAAAGAALARRRRRGARPSVPPAPTPAPAPVLASLRAR